MPGIDHNYFTTINDKKHSENADTSTSVTFDLELWPWPSVKVKKVYVIRYRLLYCTLVPGIMSVSVIVCEIWPLVHFFMPFDLRLWPSSTVKVTFICIIRWIWTLCCCVLVPSTKFLGSIEFEIWIIVWRKLKWQWRHHPFGSSVRLEFC